MGEGKIDVYCECVTKKGNDNMNEVVESDGISGEMDSEYSVFGGDNDEEGGKRLKLEGKALHESKDNVSLGQTPSSTYEDNEDDAIKNVSDRPFSQYNDIDDDGVLTPSSTDEDELFVKERKRKTRLNVYDPRVDHATFKFKVIQRFKYASACKGDVRK